MAQAIISMQGDKVALQTPYEPEFVTALKQAIDYTDRTWDREHKVWLVNASAAAEAIEVTRRYFDVLDVRNKSAEDVEEALIDAELAEIEANRQFILERAEEIEKRIGALDANVKSYSYSSRSVHKAAQARESALLAHALSNARMAAEELTEMQVRGLAAAVRKLGG